MHLIINAVHLFETCFIENEFIIAYRKFNLVTLRIKSSLSYSLKLLAKGWVLLRKLSVSKNLDQATPCVSFRFQTVFEK